jgi:hypothetical protein
MLRRRTVESNSGCNVVILFLFFCVLQLSGGRETEAVCVTFERATDRILFCEWGAWSLVAELNQWRPRLRPPGGLRWYAKGTPVGC